MDRILQILKKENGPRASSAPALELNTIIFKHVYWYMQQISGERLQDHWSSGLSEFCAIKIQIWRTHLTRKLENTSAYRMSQSRLMGKPTIYIGKNKDADQLRGNREADQRLCFRYSDSTIPLLLKSEISSF